MGNCGWRREDASPGPGTLWRLTPEALEVVVTNELNEEWWLFFNGGGPALSIPARCKGFRGRVPLMYKPARFDLYAKSPCVLARTWSQADSPWGTPLVLNITKADMVHVQGILSAGKIQQAFRQWRSQRRDAAARVLQNRVVRPVFRRRLVAAARLKAFVKPWIQRRGGMHLLLQKNARAWLLRRPIECAICTAVVPRGAFVQPRRMAEALRPPILALVDYEPIGAYTKPKLASEETSISRTECCGRCARRYFRDQLAAGKVVLRCPLSGESVTATDVLRIGGAQDVAKLRENFALDHKGRYLALNHGAEERDFTRWCRDNARACPNCYVLIFRYAGCDHMFCARCNDNFNWSQAPRVTA